MEALLVCEESRRVPTTLSCDLESLFIQSDSETISTNKEVAESLIIKAGNVHPDTKGQHKVRK